MSDEKLSLSQAIAEAKHAESQIIRLFDKRKKVMRTEYRDIEKLTVAENLSARVIFNTHREMEISNLDADISTLKKCFFELKGRINHKNLELGQSENLLKIKFMRIELKHLMDVYTRTDLFSDIALNHDTIDVSERIATLERKKIELDNKIQRINHTNYLD